MRALIEQLAAPNPLHGLPPISIAFRLVRLGWFEDSDSGMAAALETVDSIVGTVLFRRN